MWRERERELKVAPGGVKGHLFAKVSGFDEIVMSFPRMLLCIL